VVDPGLGDGYPAVADFDGDGGPEIVVSRRHRAPADRRRRRPVERGQPGGAGGPPTIADFDGDGEPEVGVAGSGYVVFDTDGAVLWQKPIHDADSGPPARRSTTSRATASPTSSTPTRAHLGVLAATNGGQAQAPYPAHGSGTALEYPVVVDVDNDGQVEIVVGTTRCSRTPNGITVSATPTSPGGPAAKIWNQHAYSITNILRVV
jgi:hypothetical protein